MILHPKCLKFGRNFCELSDATYEQIEQALRHNHGDVNLAAQELLGIPGPRQGEYHNNSKCNMHDSFTMTYVNTIKQLLQSTSHFPYLLRKVLHFRKLFNQHDNNISSRLNKEVQI